MAQNLLAALCFEVELVRARADGSETRRGEQGARQYAPPSSVARRTCTMAGAYSQLAQLSQARAPTMYTPPGLDAPAAYQDIQRARVTLFPSLMQSYAVYAGSVVSSLALIVLDVLFVVNAPAVGGGGFAWAGALAGFLLAMDLLTLVAQGVDLLCCSFKAWPLTALSWLGQLTGLAFSTALLASYTLASSPANAQQHSQQEHHMHRDALAALALGSVILHAAFTAAQLSVTLEFLMRMADRAYRVDGGAP